MTPAAQQRANELLRRLPDGPVSGAEIGVWRGHMSEALLWRKDLTLYMVDNWKDVLGYEGYSDAEQPANMQLAMQQTEFANGRRHVLHMDSIDAAKVVPGNLDFVFIDADHSYEGVRRDIEAWLEKLKPGTLLSGHDYANAEYPFGAQVKRAVDEAVAANGWTLEIGRQYTWFVRLQ